MKYFYLVFSSLKRKKLRTLLTVLSIMVAFVLFGYLTAIRQAFDAGVEVAGADRLIVRHKVSIIQLLPESYEDKIERLEGVDNAAHSTWFGGIYQEPRNFFAQMPMEPEELFDMFPEYIISDEQKAAWLETRSGALVGRGLAERFDWKVGDRIPINATIWTKKGGGRTWEFDIVAIYDGVEKGTDTSQFFFRYDFFDETRAGGTGQVGWFSVRVNDPDRAAEVAAAIDAEFANSAFETKTEPEGAFIQGFANQIGNIGFIIMSIMSAVFFTILLVAGNTMAYAVRERTGELAVLKAIGFTDRGVLGLVLGESLALTLVGGAIGLGLAWMLVSMGDPTDGSFPVFYIPFSSIFLGFALIALMAFIAGILPALQAQRLQIADALRR
ncbi:MAG: ABC transporter permease [Xanthomonadales bacterium]|nr:FtsX-like permease family protein [Gammaproteobacteria bacterium]MBT8073631.1 FtsX-like permease family protein [Gammaproteobacteria bacterium]MBT8074983.1 FtsX-like permease family protein [Gammaproteobacteria bacterium]NNK04474.1 ABC transporter permease [Xanthomonadales bacterium]NNK99751.1 ABC transporter permease [Xanthomonadales bacterium]